MNKLAWTKKRSITTLAICAIIVISSVAFLQTNNTAQAAVLDPHPGLVGWWRFDEGAGITAGDSSGNGNNGTISGATWTTGKYGNALAFNGVTNCVSLSSSALNIVGNITLEAWIKPTTVSNNHNIICRGLHATDGYRLVQVGSQIFFITYQAGAFQQTSSNAILSSGNWHHIVVVRSGTTATIYINGFDQTSVHGSHINPATSARTLRFGIYDDAVNEAFAGTIDEVRIFNRTLSQSEITTQYSNGPDSSSNLLVKVPKGTTQVITTLSWQGTGNINVTIVSPVQTYTEDSVVDVYRKTSYSTDDGSILNIKRISVPVSAPLTDEDWYVRLLSDSLAYKITVELQK